MPIVLKAVASIAARTWAWALASNSLSGMAMTNSSGAILSTATRLTATCQLAPSWRNTWCWRPSRATCAKSTSAPTAAKMGTPEAWRARIDAVRTGGIESIGDAVMATFPTPARGVAAALRMRQAMRGLNESMMRHIRHTLQRGPYVLGERFTAADTNADGRLSRDEAKAGMPRVAANFDRIDAQKRGYVTVEDIKAAADR